MDGTMKALIRESEVVLEPFTKWTQDHLSWLTTPRPDGDGYTLVEDYHPPETSDKTP